MSWISNFKRTLYDLTKEKEPREERWPATGLTALYGLDSPTTPVDIKDISASGAFLLTTENIPAGQPVALTLCRDGGSEDTTELYFSIQTRAAEQREDGLGISFLLPPGLDTDLWAVLLRNTVVLTDDFQIAETIRTLRSVLFLNRLCPSEAEEPTLLLSGNLNSDRTAALFKIVFAAERMLARQPNAGNRRAHPKLVTNILRDGSWAVDDQAVELWAGLLISSCSADSPGESNHILADPLVHITPTEARIFLYACKQVLGDRTEPGASDPAAVVLTPRKVAEITGIYDPYRNATDLAYLYNLGLIQKVFDFTSYHDVESFDVTPTPLGIELYKHCHGFRGPIAPEFVQSAQEHLATFFPPPIAPIES